MDVWTSKVQGVFLSIGLDKIGYHGEIRKLSTNGLKKNNILSRAMISKNNFCYFCIKTKITRVVRRQRSSPERADRIRKQSLNIKE